MDEGLKEVFDDISPIADYSGHLSLEFVDFTLCEDDVKYSISECKERDATYAAPLKVKVRLYNKENDEINEHEIFMGDLPLMTETGTFVINGAERVIVSQLVRSPGIYYGIDHDKVGKELFSCTVIPNRGAWLEYETDSNDVFYVRVNRTRKVPITVLIRALGIGTNQEIIDYFGEEPKIVASFGKDVANSYEEGLLELYKKIRPGEPLTVESAQSLITAMFFDPRRYDLAKVGRYKFNKKLALRNRINGQVLAEDVVDVTTGEIIAEKGTTVTRELADAIQNAGVPFVWVQAEERNVKILSNLMVDINAQIEGIDAKELGVLAATQQPDDLVVGVQVLDHNERLIGAQRKETRKVNGAVGGDLNRLHADALFGHAPYQALTVLAVKSLLVVKNLVGTLAARGNRRIGTSVLLDPSLDDCDFLGNLAVGHLVVLSALRSLFVVLALDLYDLCLLLLDLRERRRRRDNFEQLPA